MKGSIKIVIVGAGFGGVYAWKHLARIARHRTDIRMTLIHPRNYFLFTPLLHEVATGGINPANIVEPIRNVLGCAAGEFILGRVTGVRRKGKILETTAGEVPYDYLVLAPGAKTAFFGVPGAAEHALTLKTLGDAVRLKNRMIDLLERAARMDEAARRRALHVVIAGGGATGVELAAEMAEFLWGTLARYYPPEVKQEIRITLVERGAELLPPFSLPIRGTALRVLERKGIMVRLGVAIAEVRADGVTLSDGERLEAGAVVWTAGIEPDLPAFDEPLALDRRGRIVTDRTLRTAGDDHVFALGDAAAVPDGHGSDLPPFAQVAVAEAAVAAENLVAAIDGKPLRDFTYRRAGLLVSLGQWMAAGEVAYLTFSGRFAWWLWRTVYLSKLISWRKKFKVAVDWTVNLFAPRDISEL